MWCGEETAKGCACFLHRLTIPPSSLQSLDLAVDFAARQLTATAAWTLAIAPGTPAIHLDTRGLTIAATRVDGVATPFELGSPHEALGTRLTVPLPPSPPATLTLAIDYVTTADCPALQWLEPGMTAGGDAPFLFTQCQAIHARSLVPCADTPGVKFTYDARVTVPAGLTAVMSAVAVEEEEKEGGNKKNITTFSFTQTVPLSSYLLALAVGDLAKADLSPRIAVWAEPPTLARAAATFGEAETFLQAVESVASAPYRWTRADMLVLPPSFPYGGMENPCMTFLTPTLLGRLGADVDTGPASVVAHELAHSVFGNDVSCASWAHFFLNEGWCVWCERKVLASVRGEGAAALSAAAGAKALAAAVRQFGATHPYTRLVVNLEDGQDPDDAFSRVPYEKGCALITALEGAAGSAAFCEWVAKVWVKENVGKAVTAGDLQASYTSAFPIAAATIDWDAWLHAPGLPPGFEAATAAVRSHHAVAAADAAAVAWAQAAAAGDAAVPPATPSPADVASWSSETTAYFLDALADALAEGGEGGNAWPLPLSLASALGTTFHLDAATAPEVRATYLCLAAPSGHGAAVDGAEAMAREQGRMKYSRPLLRALAAADPDRARAVFGEVRGKLHPICEKMVAGDLKC